MSQWIVPVGTDAEWHAIRKKHIGASEVAALLMHDHPYTTPHGLWAEKRGLISGELDHPWLRYGLQMEPVIAQWLDETYQLGIMKSNEYHRNPDHPHLGVSLDYYALNTEEGPALLEIKSANAFQKGWTETRAPLHIEIQVQAQLLTVNKARIKMGYTPFNRVLIGAMRGGNVEDMPLFPRGPIPDIVAQIEERSTDFWQRCVLGGEEPELISHKDLEHIREMLLEAEEEPDMAIDLTANSDDVESVITQFEEARNAALAADRRKERARAQLMRHCLVIDGSDVTGYRKAFTESKEIIIDKRITKRDGKESTGLYLSIRDRDDE